MARARNIKPGFFENEDLAECSAHSRLLFIGLWQLADRRGVLEDRPRRIGGAIFRYETVDCDALLTELSERGFILRYQVGETRCIFIPKFGEHQNPHVKEQANNLPLPDQHQTSTVQAPDEHHASHAESLLPLTESLLLNPESRDTPPTPSPGAPPKRQRGKAQTLIPDDFDPSPEMVAKACELYGLTPEQVAAKTERFRNWAIAKGQTYANWDRGWLNFMEPKSWDGEASPQPLRPKLPDGRTWNDVEEARNRKRGGFTLTEWQRQLLEIVDGKAAA